MSNRLCGPGALLLGVLACTFLIVGCGIGDRADERLEGSQAFIAGSEAFAKKEYQQAVELLSKAIELGGLPVDTYCEAMTKRALASAYLGKYDNAHADLDILAQGAPDMAAVHAARSFVLRKQGKTAEADRELARARRINPQIRFPGNK